MEATSAILSGRSYISIKLVEIEKGLAFARVLRLAGQKDD